MLRHLLIRTGALLSEEEKTVRSIFKTTYPAYYYHGLSIRARETTRTVFAVFYHDPERQRKPLPCKLYADDNDTRNVEELECTSDSPYWIKGRR